MNFRKALRAGIVFGAAASATFALAAAYTVGSSDNVKIATRPGVYRDANFFNSVATAAAADASLATNPCVSTAPSVSTGFGTNAAVTKSSTGCAFSMSTGTTAASNGVVTLPQATDGWTCAGQDVTTSSNAIFLTKMTAEGANSVTLDGFQSNGAVGNWAANDVLAVSCFPF